MEFVCPHLIARFEGMNETIRAIEFKSDGSSRFENESVDNNLTKLFIGEDFFWNK
jgi:hypothetical protein